MCAYIYSIDEKKKYTPYKYIYTRDARQFHAPPFHEFHLRGPEPAGEQPREVEAPRSFHRVTTSSAVDEEDPDEEQDKAQVGDAVGQRASFERAQLHQPLRRLLSRQVNQLLPIPLSRQRRQCPDPGTLLLERQSEESAEEVADPDRATAPASDHDCQPRPAPDQPASTGERAGEEEEQIPHPSLPYLRRLKHPRPESLASQIDLDLPDELYERLQVVQLQKPSLETTGYKTKN